MLTLLAVATVIILLFVPTIPLILYVLGQLVPEDHAISKSTVLKTSPEKVWRILTNVRDYPAWQPSLESIVFKEQAEGRAVFLERSKRKRETLVVNLEQEYGKTLVRIIEQNCAAKQQAQAATPGPTFIGSWTIELTTTTQHSGTLITITERGTITKPIVRLLQCTVFGYGRRIDRFLRDLSKRVQQQESITTVSGGNNVC